MASRSASPRRGATARLVLGLGVSALLFVAGAAISMTGVAAFFGFPLMAVGLLALITTPILSRSDPAAAPCPWCDAKLGGPRKPGSPIICPECKRTIVIGPPETRCECRCPAP